MDALQFITLASPVLPVVAGIIVGYFDMWWDIIQNDHTEIIVVAGVGMVRMVYIPEIAGDFDGFVSAQPQHVTAIAFTWNALNPTDDGSGRNMNTRK
jgi:ABC-type microcin C transport system permease subunit YejE